MNINLKLSGVAERAVEEMIRKGYASTKTEAIRMAVLDYKQHHMEKEYDKMSKKDIRDLEDAKKEYKKGKAVSLRDI